MRVIERPIYKMRRTGPFLDLPQVPQPHPLMRLSLGSLGPLLILDLLWLRGITRSTPFPCGLIFRGKYRRPEDTLRVVLGSQEAT